MVSVEAIDAQVYEGGADEGRIRLRLSEAVDLPSAVSYQTFGTAQRGRDYRLTVGEPAPNPVLIPAGTDQLDVVVVPMVTPEMERTEAFRFRVIDGEDSPWGRRQRST